MYNIIDSIFKSHDLEELIEIPVDTSGVNSRELSVDYTSYDKFDSILHMNNHYGLTNVEDLRSTSINLIIYSKVPVTFDNLVHKGCMIINPNQVPIVIRSVILRGLNISMPKSDKYTLDELVKLSKVIYRFINTYTFTFHLCEMKNLLIPPGHVLFTHSLKLFKL